MRVLRLRFPYSKYMEFYAIFEEKMRMNQWRIAIVYINTLGIVYDTYTVIETLR